MEVSFYQNHPVLQGIISTSRDPGPGISHVIFIFCITAVMRRLKITWEIPGSSLDINALAPGFSPATVDESRG